MSNYSLPKNEIYRKEKEGWVYGKCFFVFEKHPIPATFRFAEITIYADRMVNNHGWLITLEDFIDQVESGVYAFDIPAKSKIHIDDIGSIESKGFERIRTKEDFLKEIQEAISILNGAPSNYEIASKLFKTYLLSDTTSNFKELTDHFESLPMHKRCFFDYTEHKDPLVRLMKNQTKLSIAERKYLLNDVFDDDWDESEFE